MDQPLKLNQISVTIDGSTIISRDDITSFPGMDTVIDGPDVQDSFGKPFHTIKTEGEKIFAVEVFAQSAGQIVLCGLLQESQTSPQYHTIALFDGAVTTMQYSKALLKSATSKIEKNTAVTWTYTFSCLEATPSLQKRDN